MKRTYTLLAGVLAAAASGTAVAVAEPGTPTARASRVAKVELAHTGLGTILTTSSGLTLYEFTRDRSNENSCVKISGCTKFWPPLQTTGAPAAGAGVKGSLLSTIRISGGVKQVTYAGHALYTFSEDSPHSTSYVGANEFGGRWYALSSSGRTVK